jgi:hypothetical protein
MFWMVCLEIKNGEVPTKEKRKKKKEKKGKEKRKRKRKKDTIPFSAQFAF